MFNMLTLQVLTTTWGLSVSYNGKFNWVVHVPHEYRSKVCGLCGNFDGKASNDLIPEGGTVSINRVNDLNTVYDNY